MLSPGDEKNEIMEQGLYVDEEREKLSPDMYELKAVQEQNSNFPPICHARMLTSESQKQENVDQGEKSKI